MNIRNRIKAIEKAVIKPLPEACPTCLCPWGHGIMRADALATLDDPALPQKERDLRRVALELTARSGSCPDCGHFLHIPAMSNNDVDTLVAYFEGDR